MCGICGLVSLDGAASPNPGALAAMNEALVHRGPDSEGLLIDGPVGLAMRRLSIIDLPGGDQPIANEDGSVHVVLNGAIYNYAELREPRHHAGPVPAVAQGALYSYAELRARLVRGGHSYATRSDTEVLVHLYEGRGASLLDEALAQLGVVVDLTVQDDVDRAVLVRDRLVAA